MYKNFQTNQIYLRDPEHGPDIRTDNRSHKHFILSWEVLQYTFI